MSLIKILCLGDSLTEAYGVPREKGWVHLVAKELGITMVNAGISGDNTTGMLGRCEHLLIEHKPSHMIVMGGTNDILFGLKNEIIISNIHAMSRYARYHGADCIVGIPTPIMNIEEFNFIGEHVQKRLESFQQTLINYCKDDEKAFIDFSKSVNPEHFLEDGVHLNESGHIQMKNVVATFLSKMIN